MINIIHGHPGDDDLIGPPGNDECSCCSRAASDTAIGNTENDLFLFGATFTADDHVNGGAGNDVIQLNGDYSASVTFTSTTVVNVERMTLAAGYDYSLDDE